MSVINDPKDTKQEGIKLHLVKKEIDPTSQRDIFVGTLEIFLDKRDCAHIAKTTQEGKHFWKRFRLPKMVHQ
jgi:hypothetical protein